MEDYFGSRLDQRHKALIVDDEVSNRLILKAELAKLDYEVILAENGEQAVEAFTRESPDIILMDVIMPIMDGYEATMHIKKLMGEQFIPIIFLTAVTDEKDLAKCIEVGGDDFITKPFSRTFLGARINAVERTRDLYRKVKTQHEILLHDERMAREIFNDVVMADNITLDKLQVLLKAAVIFSGDLLLTASSPGDEIYILLGDFSGHGLAAAIGALPVSQIFRGMVKKGFDIPYILGEMNKKLYEIMPADMFFAACVLTVSRDRNSITAWNGGLPDVLIVRPSEKRIVSRIQSFHLPLGIMDSLEDGQLRHLEIMKGDQIVMITDGVIEANNEQGEMFGQERLERALFDGRGENMFNSVVEALDDFTKDLKQKDDVSMVIIPCEPQLEIDQDTHKPQNNMQQEIREDARETEWSWSCELADSSLKTIDPVPVMLGYLQELADLQKHSQSLFTILAELYNNALDHGILELDSSIKTTHDGFNKYFELREKRLNEVSNALVRIKIEKKNPVNEASKLLISIEDSGKGFDYDTVISSLESNKKFSGRGIRLVEELCESVDYQGKGNKVNVVFSLKEKL